MKKYHIIPVALLFSSGLFAQGLYNNGAKIVIPAGVTVYVSGSGGNYRNETNGSNASIALDGTLKLDGNYTNNVAGSDILSTVGAASKVEFSGTASQTLGGSTTAPFVFNDLTVNNAAGLVVSKNARANGAMTFSNGIVNIGNNDFTFGPSAAIAGTPSAASFIIATGTGQVKKEYSATGSFTFPVGDNTSTAEYSPVTLNLTSGTFASGAFAGVNLVNAAYPDPYISGTYINRYWNITQTGISSFTCDAQFQYNPADVVGTESDLYCLQVDPPPITPFNPTNAALHLLSAPGLTAFGTFTGGLGIKNLALTIFLEGLYSGGSTMRQAQNATGNQFPGTTAEQLTIELHDAANYSHLIYSAGNINLSTSGAATVEIPSNFSGSYYVTIKNRNHIATVSAIPISLYEPLINYNFSNDISRAYGSNLKLLGPGVYGIFGGDENQDGVVDALDLIATENDTFSFLTGYVPTDLNGDGVVDALDLILGENNAFNFVSSITP